MQTTAPDKLHVVVAVIQRANSDVLLALRPRHAQQGGLWEFPGGKREIGETAEQALRRELNEELGIDVNQVRPLIRVHHYYPKTTILLDVWQVKHWQGEPWGREGQTVEWCPVSALHEREFPAANQSIIQAVHLPSVYLITPEPADYARKDFFYHLEACLDQGLTLLQLRSRQLNERDYSHYAETAMMLCDRYNARLMLNSSVELAQSVGTHGVHLSSERLNACEARPALPLISASCHTPEDIEQSNMLALDFIVLGPVCPTLSHPAQIPLGWPTFFELTESARCPVYALGGLSRTELDYAWTQGAQGIAAIRSLWPAD